jgi:hypothetical protein
MTARRLLSDTLVSVADGVLGFLPPEGVSAESLEVGLPVEVELTRVGDTVEVRAELLRFVTRTSFDQPPSRLTVRMGKEASS